jgi:hypothetical protein
MLAWRALFSWSHGRIAPDSDRGSTDTRVSTALLLGRRSSPAAACISARQRTDQLDLRGVVRCSILAQDLVVPRFWLFGARFLP